MPGWLPGSTTAGRVPLAGSLSGSVAGWTSWTGMAAAPGLAGGAAAPPLGSGCFGGGPTSIISRRRGDEPGGDRLDIGGRLGMRKAGQERRLGADALDHLAVAPHDAGERGREAQEALAGLEQ